MNTSLLLEYVRAVLAPAMLLAAAAALVWSLQNRFARVAGSARRMSGRLRATPSDPHVQQQFHILFLRVKRLSRAVALHYISMLLLLSTSAAISAGLYCEGSRLTLLWAGLAGLTFAAALLSLGVGLFFAWADTLSSFKAIRIEAQSVLPPST